MKEITKYWKQTCIDFGKYVQQQWARHEDADMLWLEFQEQMAAIKHNEMIRQKLEEGEEEGFDDDLMETDCNGFDKLNRDRLNESIKEMESDEIKTGDIPYSEEVFGKHFGSTQDKINSEVLQLIAENNALQEERWKKNEEVLLKIHDVCKLLSERIDGNHSLIKLTNTMVSANNIALNHLEKNVSKDMQNKVECNLSETLPQSKCYCGHTTTCDCEPETKQ